MVFFRKNQQDVESYFLEKIQKDVELSIFRASSPSPPQTAHGYLAPWCLTTEKWKLKPR